MKLFHICFTKLAFIAVCSIFLMFYSCAVKKSEITLPLSVPLPHAELQKMQSMAPLEKDGELIFNHSKTYEKNGILVLVLKGSPYEMGYARGILLQHQIRQWTIDCTYMIKKMAFGDIGLNMALSRAKKIEPFIPSVFKDELNGLSAGCGLDYQTILMLNVLDTIGKQFACTSVAVKNKNGHLIRSRTLDFKNLEYLKPSILSLYQPDQGNAFASVGPVGNISVFTAMNEKGLTFGVHDISGSTPGWEGLPAGLLYRTIIQNANTVDDAGYLLKKASRCLPQMAMVTDATHAAIFEFNSKNVKSVKMEHDSLILTNHTRALNIGRRSDNSLARYQEAVSFLKQFNRQMTEEKLIELNRQTLISKLHAIVWINIHSAVFNSNTLDFWIAVDSPKASLGKWVGFNLENELHHSGNAPDIHIFPPLK